nr:MAG TPA: hypothetical protein [Caudoviricetes sp.]
MSGICRHLFFAYSRTPVLLRRKRFHSCYVL